MITQAQLEAGADAVANVASQHGVSGMITRDMEIQLAAAVIKAYQAAVEDEAPKQGSEP